jgi:hypothetical protein
MNLARFAAHRTRRHRGPVTTSSSGRRFMLPDPNDTHVSQSALGHYLSRRRADRTCPTRYRRPSTAV